MTKAELEDDLRVHALFPDLDHCLPLPRAALANALDLAFLQPEAAMPRTWLKARNMPLVAVLVDTFVKPRGPGQWRCAPLTAWAEIAILHRAGAENGHYAHAVELAKTHHRTLLIESSIDGFDDWLALLQRQASLPLEVME